MFFVVLGAFVVALIGVAWLLQRLRPGRIDIHASSDVEALRRRAADESTRTGMSRRGPGGLGGR